MPDERLKRQIAFIVEIDKLKQVLRQTFLMDGSRQENDAEHSWHFAMMAALLAEYSPEPIDVGRAVRMALIHDLVEIDAGDTFRYDAAGQASRVERERAAADRLFALLPADQAADLRALWEEFEARESAEAKFAAAIDRLQPLLHNYHTDGAAWRRHGVRVGQVIEHNSAIADGAPALWAYAQGLIREVADRGLIKP